MKYRIEQKITALANKYYVYRLQDEQKQLISFAQQKRFAFKEQIEVYSDDSKQSVVFRIKAEKVMDIHGKLNVTDPDGVIIGSVRKSFKSSFFRSTWEILQDNNVYLIVQERDQMIAILRRVWGFIPFAGDLPFPFKFHFDFMKESTRVGKYDKLTLLRDHYELDLDDDVEQTIGWQTAVAQAIILDALQGR